MERASGSGQAVFGEESDMSTENAVQYVSDANGKPISVIVPIELWREIE
jgi:hypothetical protein